MSKMKIHLFKLGSDEVTMCGRKLKDFSTIWPGEVDCNNCLASYFAMGEEAYHEKMAGVNPFHWVNIHFDLVAEMIPVQTCVSHEDGMETCWGQEGHLWASGHHQIMTLCLPKLENA